MNKNKGTALQSAEIISVGTELLLGQVLNTDASYLAQKLSELGINCYWQQTVGDNPQRLRAAIDLALSRSDLLLFSGGLGPTSDDITLEVAAAVCGLPLVEEPTIWRQIQNYFADRGLPCPANNKKQALVPQGALILPNSCGTAPGLFWQFKQAECSKYFALLPGPPQELKTVFELGLQGLLQCLGQQDLHHCYLKFYGIGESALVERLADLIAAQTTISIAPYASAGEIMLRLSLAVTKGAQYSFEPVLSQIRARVGQYIYSETGASMAETVADLLLQTKKTVAFAESCTAGMASSELAALPGASQYLLASFVCYSNTCKQRILKVQPDILAEEGSVSEACVAQMASSALEQSEADYALAISGIAGPTGGSTAKPLGTICLALASNNWVRTFSFNFIGARNKIRRQAVLQAYDILRRELLVITKQSN